MRGWTVKPSGRLVRNVTSPVSSARQATSVSSSCSECTARWYSPAVRHNANGMFMQHSAVSMSRLRKRRVARSGSIVGTLQGGQVQLGRPARSHQGRPLLLAEVDHEEVTLAGSWR